MVRQEHLLLKCWAPAGVLHPTPPCGHFPHLKPGHASCTILLGARMDPLRKTNIRERIYINSTNDILISATSNTRVFLIQKQTDKESVFVTTSSKATQSHNLHFIPSVKCYTVQQHFFQYVLQLQKPRWAGTKQSCSLLMLWGAVPEEAAGKQPTSRWRQTQWPT